MKKNIKYLLFLCVILLFVSCKKNGFGVGSPFEDDGHFDLIINLDKHTTAFSGNALVYAFTSNFDEEAEVSYIKVEEEELNENITDNYFWMVSNIDTTALSGKEGDFFGKTITVDIGGETGTFYSPKTMNATLTNLNVGGNFSKANGIDIEWSVDSPIEENPVIIVVEFNPLLAANQNELPNDSVLIAKKFEAEEKDGIIKIGSSDLNDFPIGGALTINIGRGNIAVTSGAKEYKILAYTIEHITGRKLDN